MILYNIFILFYLISGDTSLTGLTGEWDLYVRSWQVGSNTRDLNIDI